jgi:hypothetical protein
MYTFGNPFCPMGNVHFLQDAFYYSKLGKNTAETLLILWDLQKRRTLQVTKAKGNIFGLGRLIQKSLLHGPTGASKVKQKQFLVASYYSMYTGVSVKVGKL